MSAIASQITSLTIVYWSVYSDADQRKHQSSASLAFVQRSHRWPVNSPHRWPVTRKMFPFDDVIMNSNLRQKHTIFPTRWQQRVMPKGSMVSVGRSYVATARSKPAPHLAPLIAQQLTFWTSITIIVLWEISIYYYLKNCDIMENVLEIKPSTMFINDFYYQSYKNIFTWSTQQGCLR